MPEFLGNAREAQRFEADPTKINLLITALATPEGQSSQNVRQEIEILVSLLQANALGMRWLAAEGLTIMGRKSLEPLLHALIHQIGSYTLRGGAHHVLYNLLHHPFLLDEPTKEIIRPVYGALTALRPAVSVQIAAYNALQQLSRGG